MQEALENTDLPERHPLERQLAASNAGPRLVYFAAERTLLGWVRTALGLMAFGFVVDRFGLVLRHLNPEAGTMFYPRIFSTWAGTALVVSGVVMNLAAIVRYLRFMIRYRREGSTDPGHGLVLAVFFTILIAAAGGAIAVFLMKVSM